MTFAYAITLFENYSVGENTERRERIRVFVEWRKIKSRHYAYARIAEWNKDRQRSLEEQIYLGSTLEKAVQKLEEIAVRRSWLHIDATALVIKLREKFPG